MWGWDMTRMWKLPGCSQERELGWNTRKWIRGGIGKLPENGISKSLWSVSWRIHILQDFQDILDFVWSIGNACRKNNCAVARWLTGIPVLTKTVCHLKNCARYSCTRMIFLLLQVAYVGTARYKSIWFILLVFSSVFCYMGVFLVPRLMRIQVIPLETIICWVWHSYRKSLKNISFKMCLCCTGFWSDSNPTLHACLRRL